MPADPTRSPAIVLAERIADQRAIDAQAFKSSGRLGDYLTAFGLLAEAEPLLRRADKLESAAKRVLHGCICMSGTCQYCVVLRAALDEWRRESDDHDVSDCGPACP